MLTFLLIALFLVSTFMITIDTKNQSLRWFGFIGYFGIMCTIAILLRENVLPGISQTHELLLYLNIVFVIKILLFAGAVFGPYPFLMFCIYYSGLFPTWKKRLTVLFLIPSFLIWIFMREYLILNTPPFMIIVAMATAYFIIGSYFLIYSYLIEKNNKIKNERLITLIIYLPLFLYLLLINYLAPVFEIFDLWKYNSIVIINIVLLGVLASRFGVMGIRLKIEKDASNTFKKMTSGFLNHTLKNEVSKIAIIADNIRYASSKEESDECVQIIKESTTQMMEMIKRINQQMQDVLLKETTCCLNDIIESTVKSASIYIGSTDIEIDREYEETVLLNCDNVHVKEVILNILKNAIEAQGDSGKIHIKLYRNKNYIVVEIMDTGCGISKEELSHITEPFWSKKNDIKSMGLGLAYCNKIMHYYGSLNVYSEVGKGTTVYLNFSSKKLSAMAK